LGFKVIASQIKEPSFTPRWVFQIPILAVLFAFAVSLTGFSCKPSLKSDMPVVPLKVDGHEVWAEVANKEATRSSGLMFRRELDWDNGMLFVFKDSATRAFWMKNTMIPLSIAFMDEKGTILNISEMSPQDLTSIWSNGPARYALEMNAGWFTKEGIKPGDTAEGVLKAPKAQD
jgi:hypothetical protein